MRDIDLGEEDGFLDVVRGADHRRIDLYQVRNQLAEIHSDCGGVLDDFYSAVAEWMSKNGWPDTSVRTAYKFCIAVNQRMEELKKKDAPTSESSVSADSSQESTSEARTNEVAA